MDGSDKCLSLGLHLTLKKQTKAMKCITFEVEIRWLVYRKWAVVLQVLFWTLSTSQKASLSCLTWSDELDSLADGWETHSESQVNCKIYHKSARLHEFAWYFFVGLVMFCLKALRCIKKCINFHGLCEQENKSGSPPQWIGHVNIGIIFYCIGDSQWCIFNTQSRSNWYLDTQYCKLDVDHS